MEHGALFSPYKEIYMPVRDLEMARIHALKLCAVHFHFYFAFVSFCANYWT